MIRSLWDRQFNAIIDVKLGDTDADTYKYDSMASLLYRWEKINKYKHSKHCHDQQIFFLFCLLVYGMLGNESLVVISQLSLGMAEKRKKPLSQVQGQVNGHIAIAVARPY